MRYWLGAGAILIAALAFGGDKKPLDASVYDGWRSIASPVVSRDGRWVGYVYRPQEGDSEAEIRRADGSGTIKVPRLTSWTITRDSKFAFGTQVPAFLEARKARRDKVKPEDQPKNNLVLVDLTTSKVRTIEKVASVSFAPEGSNYLLYRLEPAKEAPKPPEPKPAEPKAAEPRPAEPKAAEPKAAEPKKDDKAPKKKDDHRPGQTFQLLNLANGQESKIENLASFAWSRDGSVIALSISEKDGANDRVEWRELSTGNTKVAAKGLGRYARLVLDASSKRLAFTTDKDDYAAKKPAQSLYLFDPKSEKLTRITEPKNPTNFVVSEFGSVRWSEKGRRLFFPIGPKPVEDKEVPDDEKVAVDVWSWQDPVLQPQQLLQARTERERTYDAIFEPESGKTTQLESPELPSLVIADKGDGDVALAETNLPYRQLMSWDGQYEDAFLVDVKTGTRNQIATKLRGAVSMSPTGKYAVVIDEFAKTVTTISTDGKRTSVEHQATIPTPLFDLDDDHPDAPPSYGTQGWTANEDRVILKDKYDLWAVDPTGKAKPKQLTFGRLSGTSFSRIIIDPEKPEIQSLDSLMLATFSDQTKQRGIARLEKGGLKTLLSGPKAYTLVSTGRVSDTVLFSQETVTEYPNLWVSNLNFEKPILLTDANPQQKDFNWLTVELVSWRSADGVKLDGMLYKPENFDYAKKYPMITYFYERDSDGLFAHRVPAPSASTVNIPLYCSNGYVVFVPDIPYKVGYPGESAISAIVSGVNSIVDRGYVDPKRLGIQGQSWGGYQVAYMVTETDMFAAAEAGAPVSNMFSAYGGIRYGSGLVRQFQYERQQSRIGGTPWNSTLRYIENSPIFFADKVKTPLMIMHNDKDGAVPYTQSIEYFTALRRLGKPSWLVVYNDEDHNLIQRKNRKDLSIRMKQFFDHYLMATPMPEWMAKGVPAKDKGRNMGFELVPPKG